MAYGIVKQSGGYIWVYSEPGLGTTVKLYFPSVAETPLPRPQPVAEKPSPNAGGTVLVVEDDSLVRNMVRRALSDAVLTDLAMPELGGRLLAQRLVEESPDLPVVFMSGYTDDDVTRPGLLDAGVPFLEKPLSPDVLTRKMRRYWKGCRGRHK